VRIAYDVTPLSHPRTGVGNYILGALKGMAEAADGSYELVAFGPVSIRGRRLLDSTLADLPVERRILTVPFGHAVRTAWSRLGRPPAERFLGRMDVLHFTDWMVPPGRPRVRATMIHDLGPLRYPERLHPRTVRMHSATARAAAGCDVVFTNAEYTANDVVEQLGIPRERIRVAYPGVDATYSRPRPRTGARTAAWWRPP
jgi:glycosyltransferase involved in cell wall biosynthesis